MVGLVYIEGIGLLPGSRASSLDATLREMQNGRASKVKAV